MDELGAAGSGVAGGGVRLWGRALGLAFMVSVALLGAAVWAASVDFAPEPERNAAPLDTLAILYKLVAIAALLYVGWRWHSRSLHLLGLRRGAGRDQNARCAKRPDAFQTATCL